MIVSEVLPPTKTRESWSFTFLKNFDPASPGDGVLSIVENSGKRVRRTIVSKYLVEEQPARGFRSFLLVLESRSGDEDTATGRAAQQRIGTVYECRLFASGRTSCNCNAGSAGLQCKHGIALASLVETADLPSPLNDERDYGNVA